VRSRAISLIVLPFPSQIVDYLRINFSSFDFIVIHEKVGAVAGFCALYEQLPHELIRLPPKEYAELVASVGTISFRIKQYQVTGRGDALTPVGHALEAASRLI
jgi:hypothetical protein